jgi:SAM-dependent methyltransferase
MWIEALLLPGETDLVESGVRELAEYFGISRDEARHDCQRALEDGKREWEASRRRTPEEIKEFYRRTRSYLFEHIWWHATDIEANRVNVAILDYAKERGARQYLDFGSGVGSNSILFARHGFKVALADVSRTMLDFARWRLRRRGIEAEFIDLNEAELPASRFEFVSAVDVCEHLARPNAEFRCISRALKPGGAFVFNYRAGFDEQRPMHILATAAPLLRAIRRNGFRETRGEADALRQSEFIVVERGARSWIEDLAFGLYDRARFSRLLMSSEVNAAGSNRYQVRHPQRIYFDRVKTAIDPRTEWLDLGCGRSLVPRWIKGNVELELELKAGARRVIGVDRDLAALVDNRSCDLRLRADAARLPFADGRFALVTGNMLFEQIDDPAKALGEIRRVLRPGGRLIAITTNWLDISAVAARTVPAGLRDKLVSRAEAANDAPPFRLNRPATIARALGEAGFQCWKIDPLDQPDTYADIPLLARIESVWHRMARRWPAFRGALLIEAQ